MTPTNAKPAPKADGGAFKFFVASNRQVWSRLGVALAVATAALPIMVWWKPALWLCSVLTLAGLETVMIRRAQASDDPARQARTSQRLQAMTTLSGVNYAIISSLFWTSGAAVGQAFAIGLIMVVTLYFLLMYYSRWKVLLTVIAPLVAATVLGVIHTVWTSLAAGVGWTGLTAVLLLLIVAHYFNAARLNMIGSWSALRAARSQAVERGHAAEAASEAKSAFLATMSHEIRTPLNGVLGMAQAMEADDLSPVQRERLLVVRQSGEALLTILNDILDFSKIEAGKIDLESIDFDLAALIRSSKAVFSEAVFEKGLELVIDVDPAAEGVFRGDPTRIRQILANLMSNAVKFTVRGEIRVRAERTGGQVAIAVSDTGEGVAADQIERLFDKFVQADASTTRRYGGTGLGLAICRDLAALMGGDIKLQSALGRGSTFTLSLPLERTGDALPSPAEDKRPAPDAAYGALRVLAAEDNPMNQLVLKTLLAQIGLEPVVVADGAQALDAWRGEPWDLILMDVQMPVMDGLDATRAIRAAEAEAGRGRTPIVALTANAMAHQVSEYRAAGMDAHVAKPIDARQLYDVVARALNGEPQAAAAKVA